MEHSDVCTVCNGPLILRIGKYCSKKCNSKHYNKKYYHENKKRENERKRLWVVENRDHVNENQKKYRLTWLNKDDNREKTKIRLEKYRKENRDADRASKKKWQDNNKDLCVAKNAKRRAKKLNATIEGYDDEIKEIYKKCPQGYHVDHIVPLVNSKVCGLHVPWNLQIITAEENLKKSNKFIIN